MEQFLSPILGPRDLFFLNAIIFIMIGLGSILYLLIVSDLDSSFVQQLVPSKVPVSTD